MAIDDANWVAQPRDKWYHGNYSIPLCLEGVRRCQMRTKHGVICPVPRRYRLQGEHVENTYHKTTPINIISQGRAQSAQRLNQRPRVEAFFLCM